MPKSKQDRASGTKSPQNKETKQTLQERLHTLLTRLSETSEILKTWPESKSGEDSSIHKKTTMKLIASLQKIVQGVKLVEDKVLLMSAPSTTGAASAAGTEGSAATINVMQDIQIPLDLLEMMDYANGLNPDCFARGLLGETMRQLANLENRKLTLKLLAAEVQNGIQRRKRDLDEDNSKDDSEPSLKRRKIEDSSA